MFIAYNYVPASARSLFIIFFLYNWYVHYKQKHHKAPYYTDEEKDPGVQSLFRTTRDIWWITMSHGLNLSTKIRYLEQQIPVLLYVWGEEWPGNASGQAFISGRYNVTIQHHFPLMSANIDTHGNYKWPRHGSYFFINWEDKTVIGQNRHTEITVSLGFLPCGVPSISVHT